MKKAYQKTIKEPKYLKIYIWEFIRTSIILASILLVLGLVFNFLYFRYLEKDFSSNMVLSDSLIRDAVKYNYEKDEISEADFRELKSRLYLDYENYNVATAVFVDGERFIDSSKYAELVGPNGERAVLDESNLMGFADFCNNLSGDFEHWSFSVPKVCGNDNKNVYIPDSVVAYNYVTGEGFVYNVPRDNYSGIMLGVRQGNWIFSLASGGDIGISSELPLDNEQLTSYSLQTKNSDFVTIEIYRTDYNFKPDITTNRDSFIRYGIILGVILDLLISLVYSWVKYTQQKAVYEMFEYRRKTSAAMAHDLKTPLAVISAYAEDLEENINSDKRSYYAAKINENVTYMTGLIKDILDFSNSQYTGAKIKKEAIDVRLQIDNIVSSMEGAFTKRGLTVEVTGNRVLNTDKKMWTQAVSNLLSNAARYASEDTVISVSITDKRITITNNVDETITDVERFLEPFVKGEKSRGENAGSGLGLAVSDNNLGRLGFKLNISSSDNKFMAEIKG